MIGMRTREREREVDKWNRTEGEKKRKINTLEEGASETETVAYASM